MNATIQGYEQKVIPVDKTNLDSGIGKPLLSIEKMLKPENNPYYRELSKNYGIPIGLIVKAGLANNRPLPKIKVELKEELTSGLKDWIKERCNYNMLLGSDLYLTLKNPLDLFKLKNVGVISETDFLPDSVKGAIKL